MDKSPVITLPDDADLRSRLERKLEEYQIRVQDHPFSLRIALDSEYKSILIEELLEHGKVATWKVCNELAKKYSYVDSIYFVNACAVINAYCRDGGKELIGGTGLN